MADERIDIVITETGSKSAKRNIGDIGKSAGKSAGLLDGLRGVLGLLAGALSVRAINEYSEAWAIVNTRIGLVTDTTNEFVIAQGDVFAIAQDTLSPLRQTAELYARLTKSGKELSLTQQDVAGITETINKAMVVSGGSVQSQTAALIQLNQAFASGVLRGEEYNSISEQAPRLTEALGTALNKTQGELRDFAKQGRLTSEIVTLALQSQAATIAKEFESIAVRPTQAFTRMANSVTRLVGELGELSGHGALVVDTVTDISKAIDTGFIQSEFLRQLVLWKAGFDEVTKAGDEFGNELQLLTDIADDLLDLGQEAFTNFPANIIAVTKIGAVEVASFMQQIQLTYDQTILDLDTSLTTFIQENAVRIRDFLAKMRGAAATLPIFGDLAGAASGITKLNTLIGETKIQLEAGKEEQLRINKLVEMDNELRLETLNVILQERDALIEKADIEGKTFAARRKALEEETAARAKQRLEDALAKQNQPIDLNTDKIQSFADAGKDILLDLSGTADGLNTKLTDAFSDAAVSLRGEFSDAVAESIVSGENFGDVFRSAASTISQSLLSAIIDIGVQQAANFALGETLKTASTASSVASSATVATAAAPAAALTATASFGSSAIAGAAALAAILALASSSFAD
ncbi:MAG: hypothetical protein COA47_10470, partial [Robiginitomaculum sp.]